MKCQIYMSFGTVCMVAAAAQVAVVVVSCSVVVAAFAVVA